MQEEDANNDGSRSSETIGWVAIEEGVGDFGDLVLGAGSETAVDNAGSSITLPGALSSGAAAIAQLTSFAGSDPAWTRGEAGPAGTLSVSVEEDRSADQETFHFGEEVDWLAFSEAGTVTGDPLEPVLETGTTTLTDDETTLTLDGSYETPVVTAFVSTQSGPQPVTVRVTEAAGNQLTLRLQEPNNLDGNHVNETVHYAVAEAGAWELPDGTLFEAGTVDTDLLSEDGFESVSFAAEFAEAPAVLSQVQSFNENDFVVTRQRDVTADGFDFAIQEEEALNDGHAVETVGWMAFEAGSFDFAGVTFEAGRTDASVDSGGATVSFGAAFDQAPGVVGQLSSYDGSDPAWARGTAVDTTGFSVFAEEDTSQDPERGHVPETLDWFAFEQGVRLLASEADTLVA